MRRMTDSIIRPKGEIYRALGRDVEVNSNLDINMDELPNGIYSLYLPYDQWQQNGITVTSTGRPLVYHQMYRHDQAEDPDYSLNFELPTVDVASYDGLWSLLLQPIFADQGGIEYGAIFTKTDSAVFFCSNGDI